MQNIEDVRKIADTKSKQAEQALSEEMFRLNELILKAASAGRYFTEVPFKPTGRAISEIRRMGYTYTLYTDGSIVTNREICW